MAQFEEKSDLFWGSIDRKTKSVSIPFLNWEMIRWY